jgi:hypothetical protein
MNQELASIRGAMWGVFQRRRAMKLQALAAERNGVA